MNETGINFDGSDYLEGKFLIAMPGMGDTRFEKSVIYICAHTEKGAMGFMINRALSTPSISDFFTQLGIINKDEALDLSSNYKNVQLYTGGPVEPGRGFVLHSPEFKGESTLCVDENVCLTATLEILRAIVTGKGPKKILLALGYSGWAAGQLEEEIISNGWLISLADSKVIFGRNNTLKYEQALNILGVDPLLLSPDAGHA
ncbi:MAG: YqgE/AlgH family protein [Rhizobiaceae bacterium]|nr:YqgE/AlgH family protein [Rhizobiaceae bacterium]